MKFFGMFHSFKSSMETGKTNDFTADELLAQLVDAEWDYRQNRRIERIYPLDLPAAGRRSIRGRTGA
jgi:hypothetical protein